MSTEFKTEIRGIRILRFAGKKGLMFLIDRKLDGLPTYTGMDVYQRLNYDTICLTKDEVKKLSTKLLEIIKEEV